MLLLPPSRTSGVSLIYDGFRPTQRTSDVTKGVVAILFNQTIRLPRRIRDRRENEHDKSPIRDLDVQLFNPR